MSATITQTQTEVFHEAKDGKQSQKAAELPNTSKSMWAGKDKKQSLPKIIKQHLNHQGPPDGNDSDSSDDEDSYQGPHDPHVHDCLAAAAANN